MASTTYTADTYVNSPTYRNIYEGVFAAIGTFAYTATMSASNTFFLVPVPDQCTIVDGWVFSNHTSSTSFKVKVGWPDATSLFLAATTLDASVKLALQKGLPHVVTMTDSDSFPRSKPLTVTVVSVTSGTIAAGEAITAMLLLQK